ncbi:hypothetical protein YC2023_050334 [Brassica napus]
MSLSVDNTSSTTIDCHFIVSIDTEQVESEHDLVATTIKACFIRIPTKKIRTGLGGDNHQGSIHMNSWIYVKKK